LHKEGGYAVEKKVLIAVDGSVYSRKAIEYTVKIASIIKDLKYVLINIQPKISEFLIEDARADSKARSALKKVTNSNQENSMKILEESKSLMTKLGVNSKNIETVSQPVTRGTAKAILDYGKQSLCDSIVMGRRGISRLAEMFTGSVTNNVLEHTNVIPVWAIGGDITSSKIMVAIDGSESALKAVDHVIFMVGENPDIQVTLLHITPRLRDYCTIEFDDKGDIVEDVITQGDKRCVDDFYTHAQKKFEEAGIKESQIDIKQVTSKINIGKAIVDEARKGDYGTVVVGRRGTNNSFFMGNVSRHVLINATDCAVWLVP
jgi:nucleotide-binding universal stress UspA family protein